MAEGFDHLAARYEECLSGTWSRLADHLAAQLHDIEGPVLDVGCGSGRLARALALRGHQVLGLDLSPAMLDAAAADAPRTLDLELGAIEEARLPRHSFGLVVVCATASYLEPPLAAVESIGELVAPGGRVLYCHPQRSRDTQVQGIVFDMLREHSHSGFWKIPEISAGLRPRLGEPALMRACLADASFQVSDLEPFEASFEFPDADALLEHLSGLGPLPALLLPAAGKPRRQIAAELEARVAQPLQARHHFTLLEGRRG